MKHYLLQTIRPLIGKTISRALLKDGSVTIWFDDGTSVFCSVEGDCCSLSTYYGIDFRGDWRGPLVDVAEGIENTDDPRAACRQAFDCDGDSLSLWNVEFRTETGAIVLKHINDSNGYYDGSTSYRIQEAPLSSVLSNN